MKPRTLALNQDQLKDLMTQAIDLYHEFVSLHEYSHERATYTAVGDMLEGLEIAATPDTAMIAPKQSVTMDEDGMVWA